MIRYTNIIIHPSIISSIIEQYQQKVRVRLYEKPIEREMGKWVKG